MLDATTTELADELVGGVLSAGPDRLEAAGRGGLPQVVSLGALDMVNFGPRETRAAAVRGPEPLRAQPDGDADAHDARGVPVSSAARSAASCPAATGPTALFVPLGGVSMIAVAGQPFHDPEADAALFAGLRETLDERVEVHERAENINDPAFAIAMADRLHELIQGAS